MRYFFHIGYSGTRYNGWQKLPGNNSVQFAIESALSRILKTPIAINGCGRTDTAVHASQYFFHADLELNHVDDTIFKLNKNLPADIAIFDVIAMEGKPHARLDAVARTYSYFIHRYKDPFLVTGSSYYPDLDLDLQNMKSAASLLINYNDYRYFYRTGSKPRTTYCHISHTELFSNASRDRLKFTITGNRFLAGMVRIIVHRLLEVGRGRMTVETFENYLKGTSIPDNVKSAHPQGLFLSKVSYPFLDIPPRTQFDQFVNSNETWKAI